MSRHQPIISLIWAMSENRVIGRNNELPWYLPADLQHFKALTLGKPIVMGRKTWESLPGLLPNRLHIVVTHNIGYRANDCMVVHSIDEAIAQLKDVDELMIVGGSAIYAEALPLASRLYLTLVHAEIEGDTYFPALDLSRWCEVERESHMADANNYYSYSFIKFERMLT